MKQFDDFAKHSLQRNMSNLIDFSLNIHVLEQFSDKEDNRCGKMTSRSFSTENI